MCKSLLVFHRNYVCTSYYFWDIQHHLEIWCDLVIWVRGHSRSLKIIPFESLSTIFYSHFTVTISMSRVISVSLLEYCHNVWFRKTRTVWLLLSFFLRFLFGVAHAPFACQHWGLPNAQPQGRDYCSVAQHHQANLMVCVVCSCCATSPYREVCRAQGGIGSGETLCTIFTLLGL